MRLLGIGLPLTVVAERGLVFPLLVIVTSLALADSAPSSSVSLLGGGSLVFTQLAFGPSVGIAIGWLGARLIDHANVGGNGFFAAFACGLTVGAIS